MDRNCFVVHLFVLPYVALRKESVDRNARILDPVNPELVSLSARRAWIEILALRRQLQSPEVALRKESVDRNAFHGVPPSSV